MKIVLDACVIYPTVMREVLIGCAARGLLVPVWSDRIIEEWLRAAAKLGPDGHGIAAAEAAVMQDQFPTAMCNPVVQTGIRLPDANDVHVVACAVEAQADGLMTAKTRDFPLRVLREFGLARLHPDDFLTGEARAGTVVQEIVRDVVARAERVSGRPQEPRSLLKRAGMPRLGKLLAQASQFD